MKHMNPIETLDTDVLDSFRYIHDDQIVEFRHEKAVGLAFSALKDVIGEQIGEQTDDISNIEDAGRLIDLVENIAVYWNPDSITLVGDVYGPWAVNVTF